MSQKTDVLNYMRDNDVITQREADRDLGVSRLSARIYDIEKDGIPIFTRLVPVRNRRGEKRYVMQYSLKKFEEEEKNER